MKYGFTFKPVFTWSPSECKVRLFRLIWNRRYDVNNPRWIGRTLSLGLQPKLLCAANDCQGWKIWFLGIVIHWSESWGGHHV